MEYGLFADECYMFQSLIGRLQTITLSAILEEMAEVSIPHR